MLFTSLLWGIVHWIMFRSIWSRSFLNFQHWMSLLFSGMLMYSFEQLVKFVQLSHGEKFMVRLRNVKGFCPPQHWSWLNSFLFAGKILRTARSVVHVVLYVYGDWRPCFATSLPFTKRHCFGNEVLLLEDACTLSNYVLLLCSFLNC